MSFPLHCLAEGLRVGVVLFLGSRCRLVCALVSFWKTLRSLPGRGCDVVVESCCRWALREFSIFWTENGVCGAQDRRARACDAVQEEQRGQSRLGACRRGRGFDGRGGRGGGGRGQLAQWGLCSRPGTGTDWMSLFTPVPFACNLTDLGGLQQQHEQRDSPWKRLVSLAECWIRPADEWFEGKSEGWHWAWTVRRRIGLGRE